MRTIDEIIKDNLSKGGKRNRPHKGIGVSGAHLRYKCGGNKKVKK